MAPPRKRSAFSLIEVLVAATVLVPLMLVLLGIFPFAYGMNHKAAELTDVQEVARDQLEQLRAQDFDSLADSQIQLSRDTLQLNVSVHVEAYPTGQATVRQKRADVLVSWRDSRGPQSYKLSTLLYRWGQ